MAHADREEAAARDAAARDAAVRAAEAADREFATALERRGIRMPPDLAPGVLAGNRSLRAMSRLLRDREAEAVDV